MMEQEHTVYDISEHATKEEAEAFKEHFERWSRSLKGPYENLRDNADKCLRILEMNGANERDCDIRSRFGDASAAFMAKEWLGWFRKVEGIRGRIVTQGEKLSDVEMLVLCALELGKIQERMWWRLGVDPATGARREQLALERRKSRTALNSAEAKAQRRDKMRSKIKAAARWRAAAQKIADSYFSRHPNASKPTAARFILKHWPKDWPTNGFRPSSESTIRQAIRKT